MSGPEPEGDYLIDGGDPDAEANEEIAERVRDAVARVSTITAHTAAARVSEEFQVVLEHWFTAKQWELVKEFCKTKCDDAAEIRGIQRALMCWKNSKPPRKRSKPRKSASKKN